ncbi:MAG: hypothetical protein OEV87_10845 [Phycisphaerae bacterium]|nr:hypothetical protein [Phycisphaerae bacterium]
MLVSVRSITVAALLGISSPAIVFCPCGTVWERGRPAGNCSVCDRDGRVPISLPVAASVAPCVPTLSRSITVAALWARCGMCEVTLAGLVQVGGISSLISTSIHRAYRTCGCAHLRMQRSTIQTMPISTAVCHSIANCQLHHCSAIEFIELTILITPFQMS